MSPLLSSAHAMAQQEFSMASVPAEVRKIIDEGHFIYVATVRPSNKPHVSLVAYVFENGKMAILSRATTVKVRNLKRNPNISGLIVNEQRRGVLIEGVAKVHEDPETVQKMVENYYSKHSQTRSRGSAAENVPRVGIEVTVHKIIKATPGW